MVTGVQGGLTGRDSGGAGCDVHAPTGDKSISILAWVRDGHDPPFQLSRFSIHPFPSRITKTPSQPSQPSPSLSCTVSFLLTLP